MHALLEKFNGFNEKEYKLKGEERRDPLLKKFRISKLPNVLIFQIQRFTKNNFFIEKNPTIVQYPVTNLDMGPLMTGTRFNFLNAFFRENLNIVLMCL